MFTLGDVGKPDTIVMRGVDAYHSVYFSTAADAGGEVGDDEAAVSLFSGPDAGAEPSEGEPQRNAVCDAAGDTPPIRRTSESASGEGGDQTLVVRRNENNALLEATLTLPAEMLVHENELTFRVCGALHDAVRRPVALGAVEPRRCDSTIELAGSLLPLQNDLKLLPLPFYEAGSESASGRCRLCFMSQPSPKALQAAGIVASWFGIMTDFRPVRFPVSIGTDSDGECDRDRRECRRSCRHR